MNQSHFIAVVQQDGTGEGSLRTLCLAVSHIVYFRIEESGFVSFRLSSGDFIKTTSTIKDLKEQGIIG